MVKTGIPLALDGGRFSLAAMRRWVLWISLLLIALSLGWFWLLSNDLTFTRTDEGRPAVEKKGEPKKG